MMNFKPYNKHKQSDIDWLGEVPEHWGIEKPTRLFNLIKGINASKLTKEYISDNQGEFPVYSGQTEDDGLMGSIDWHDFEFEFPVIFVTTVGAKAMTTRIVSGQFSLSQNCALAIPITTTIDSRFFEYAFQRLSDYEKSSISLIMQPSLRFEDFNHFVVSCPDTKEQQAIASFLDHETARIDALIQKKERMIELLKEKRIALITQAVTKGLDPNVPMKDSGIEWLGEVPEHWEITKVGNGYSIQLGKMLQPEPAWPHDAFSAIWDDITMIKTKDWCLIRSRAASDYWGMSGKVYPLKHGDMVIIRTSSNHTFQWDVTDPTIPETKSQPEYFEYEEKPDYIPVYITLTDVDITDLKEIGLYLNGVCKGAVVVESDLEQLCAFLDIDESLHDGSVEFVFYYNDSKNQEQEMRTIRIDEDKIKINFIDSNALYPYSNDYQISSLDTLFTVPTGDYQGYYYITEFDKSYDLEDVVDDLEKESKIEYDT